MLDGATGLVQLDWKGILPTQLLGGWKSAWQIFIISLTPEIQFLIKRALFIKDGAHMIIKGSFLWEKK